MRSSRGITLAELIVCCSIFMVLLVALLATYVQGARSFQLLVSRQGVQSELRRINALLRRDLTLTDYRSVGVEDRVSTDSSDERDTLSFVGVDAWTDRDNFDEFLKPRWNIYVLYYGTRKASEKVPPAGDATLGQLIRKELTQSVPYPVPLLPVFLENVSSIPQNAPYKLLTRSLVSFEIEQNQVEENVRIHLALRAESGPTTEGRKRESELIECYIDMRPENTWPPR